MILFNYRMNCDKIKIGGIIYMSNLERPRHGWEGLTNGGEIYGNKPNKSTSEEIETTKSQMFNDMIRNGMDRAFAYQIVYSLNEAQAKELSDRDNYNNLIACGVPHEMAEKMVYKSAEKSQRTR